jgi:hypothetical protein
MQAKAAINGRVAKRVSGPNILFVLLDLLFRFILFLFVALSTVLVQVHIFLFILGIWGILVIFRGLQSDAVILFLELYAFVQLAWNYIAEDVVLYWMNQFRPFVDLYNMLIWLSRVSANVYAKVVNKDLMYQLIVIAIDMAFEIMPLFITVVQVLVPVIVDLAPAFVTIVRNLFDAFLRVDLSFSPDPLIKSLMDILVQLVDAFVPHLPRLVDILSQFITLALAVFGNFVALFIEIILQLIKALMPTILEIIPDIQLAFIDMQARLALNPPPSNTDGFTLLLRFVAIGFFAFMTVIIKIVIAFGTAIIKIIAESALLILKAVISLLKGLPAIIIALTKAVVKIISGPTLVSLIGLVTAVVVQLTLLIPVLTGLITELLRSATPVVNAFIFALVEVVAQPHSPATIGTIIGAVAAAIVTNINKVLKFALDILIILIKMFPLFASVLTAILGSGVLEIWTQAFFGFLTPLLNTVIPALLTFLLDVVLKTLIPVILEVIFDFVAGLMALAVQLIVGIDVVQLAHIFASLLDVVVDVIPLLLRLAIALLLETGTILLALVDGVLLILRMLFLDNDLIQILSNLIFAIVGGVTKILFGVDAELLQLVFDFLLSFVKPFFTLVIQIIVAVKKPVDPNAPPPPPPPGPPPPPPREPVPPGDLQEMMGDAGVLLDVIFFMGYAVGLLFSGLSLIFPLLQGLTFLLGLFKYLEPIVIYVVLPAAYVWEYVVKPVLCPLNVLCCVFYNFGSCILPGLGPCCCVTNNGCPESIPDCDCIFS